MLSNDEIITFINKVLRSKRFDENEKIEKLSTYYNQIDKSVKPTKRSALARSSFKENDWVYIFSKTYPNSYYHNLPKVRGWMMTAIYDNLDDISKIVLKQLIIFGQ